MKFFSGFFLFLTAAMAAPVQSDFYLREEIPLPPGEVMEIGSVALLPGQKVAVSTRRGDIWICDGAYGDDLIKVTWKKFAQGQHEPFGMFWKDIRGQARASGNRLGQTLDRWRDRRSQGRSVGLRSTRRRRW